MIIAVGGCYAEAQRERLFSLYPEVDVAFGPGTIPHLGEWLGAGGFGVERGAWGTGEERKFAATLPMHRERRFQAWVQISMGCNSTCSYCIVPAVRGREVSRRPGDVLAEVTHLAQQGVRELTLLGQNVNSWGRDLCRTSTPSSASCFARATRSMGSSASASRARTRKTSAARDRGDGRMRRGVRARAPPAPVGLDARPQGDAAHLFARAVPEARRRAPRGYPRPCAHTDIIVGFPGETEDDFRETMEVVEEVGFDSAFTFVYSPRAGTDAAAMRDQISDEIKRDRIERLVDVVQRVAAERNELRIGRVEEVLVEGPSRTDPSVLRGRTRRNTSVNFLGDAAPGDFVDVLIERATSTTLGGSQRVALAV